MKRELEVGDLVRDKLNNGSESYGLGVVVSSGIALAPEVSKIHGKEYTAAEIPGKRYDVYFTKFEKTITFHGDYLEKV